MDMSVLCVSTLYVDVLPGNHTVLHQESGEKSQIGNVTLVLHSFCFSRVALLCCEGGECSVNVMSYCKESILTLFAFSSNNYEMPEYAQTHFAPQDPTVENRHSV